jgi:hypothetical protein
MNINYKIVLIVVSLFIMSTSKAAAQVTKVTQKDEGYGYEFDDDPLAAGGFGPNDSRIRVRRGVMRTTLIKPRTSFIKELIKSVDDI